MSKQTDKIRKEIGGAEPGTLFADVVEVCEQLDLARSLLKRMARPVDRENGGFSLDLHGDKPGQWTLNGRITELDVSNEEAALVWELMGR